MNNTSLTPAQQAWKTLQQGPKAPRIRDAAKQLHSTELELLLADIPTSVTRLSCSPEQFLNAIPALGYVMALTRNNMAVHERKGVYTNISVSPGHMLVVGEDIDLRLFPSRWNHMFAVTAQTPKGELKSLQVFDATGTAIHKIYLTDKSNPEAYAEFVAQNTSADQSNIAEITAEVARPEIPDSHINLEEFRASWAALQDTHDFFPMLAKFRIQRMQAMRLAGEQWAVQVPVEVLQNLFEQVSTQNAEIMCFVGNNGSIQIHSGKASKLVPMEGWINVMDPEFNLHLNLNEVSSVWLVTKPSVDGDIHSVEVYDAQGGMGVQFFGRRKPGIPEREDWFAIWSSLKTENVDA